MRLACSFLVCLGLAVQAAAGTRQQAQPAPTGSVPLVLAGATVIDLTDWGHSAKDLQNAVVIIQDGRIVDVGPRALITIPANARVIDCTGKFLIPGLVDGFAGINSQGQANANLYMGVTTVVASGDDRRGVIDFAASPSPHLYLLDSVGTTDNWSLLIKKPEWAAKLKEGLHPTELSPEDTAKQLTETAHLGTRVVWLGHNLTAANTQLIVTRAHQLGLVTYGEFVSTPYTVGIEAGVDVLLHMSRYELGLIPDEPQRPQGRSGGSGGERGVRLFNGCRRWTRTFAPVRRPGLRWCADADIQHLLSATAGSTATRQEPAAALLILRGCFLRRTRRPERWFIRSAWSSRHSAGVDTTLDGRQPAQEVRPEAMGLWRINQAIYAAHPHYLAASGAPVFGSMPIRCTRSWSCW